jgi:putative tributyrin esterase
MAFCELKYFSAALGKATAANILLPEGQVGPFAVFYLLHGLSDDHTMWTRRTSIERYVSTLPLVVVMPDGGRGFYCDAQDGAAWESAIVRDLIPYVDSTFQTRADAGSRCIGGLSMGGYGAIKLALKFPDLFASASSHSGALDFAHQPLELGSERWREFSRIVGETQTGGENDCYALAEKLAPAQRPRLRIDCGVDDFLIDSNRTFHRHLATLGYAHEYAEYTGAHDWNYWDEHIQEAIAFHALHLKLFG